MLAAYDEVTYEVPRVRETLDHDRTGRSVSVCAKGTTME